MNYPNQKSVLARLENQTRKAIRKLEDSYTQKLIDKWKSCKRDIEAEIMYEYRKDFGRETWDITQAVRVGTLDRIRTNTERILSDFHIQSNRFIFKALNHLRSEELKRQAWMLDQLTPPSYKPRTPNLYKESASPRDYKSKWSTTLQNWIKAYHDSLMSNVRLEAMHEGTIHDAADEVNATRIDNFDPQYKFAAMLSTEAVLTQDEAQDDFADENDEMIESEVWLTLEDADVCYECDDNDGVSIEEIGERPPLHFNCRCYVSIVPNAWADMLAIGNADEREAAKQMEDRGLVPSSMPIYDGDDLVGHVVVTFDDWEKKQVGGEYANSR